MTTDRWEETLELLHISREACQKHSIMNDLGDDTYLKDLYQLITWQIGTKTFALTLWIEEISKKMDSDKAARRKKELLANDVGKDKVPGYLAAATLRLMLNLQLVNFLGEGQLPIQPPKFD